MPKWFKNKETIKSMEKGTIGFLIFAAIMIVICLVTQIADKIGAKFGVDLVAGTLDLDKVGWGWVAVVVAYCLGVEGLKVLKAKSFDDSQYANGEFKEAELKRMKQALGITFGMGILSLITMVYGAEINPIIYISAFIVDIIACIIGTATSNGFEIKRLEDAILADGLDENDDKNGDNQLDFLDLMIAAKENGMKMSEEQAKDLAKKMFGPTGVMYLGSRGKPVEKPAEKDEEKKEPNKEE